VVIPFFNLGPYLGDALESLAAQTYPALEILVINDGSTDPESIQVFQEMRARYAHFRFLDQKNIGIGATRNRGLAQARGKYFLPMDADNIAHPEMVQVFVKALESNTDLAAVSAYFLAFRETANIAARHFLYAYRPTGGPHILGALRNIYGDGTALYRTDALRAVGGFETDPDTSWEDWEVFIKLTNAGFALDVVPEVLFYYRHRDEGFSRTTDGYANHQRVLRQFFACDRLPAAERRALWNLLAGMHYRLEMLEEENARLRMGSSRRRLARMTRLLAPVRSLAFAAGSKLRQLATRRSANSSLTGA
jgi:glycosyltransferase involved in cell wall biosynthesis